MNNLKEFVEGEANPFCEEMTRRGKTWPYKEKKIPFPRVMLKEQDGSIYLTLSVEEPNQQDSDKKNKRRAGKSQEKRKYRRADSKLSVSYKVKALSEAEYDLVYANNIGQGGVFISTNKEFAIGTLLILVIRLPFTFQNIHVTGEVVNCKKAEEGLLYETRIKFLDLSEEAAKKINDFVTELLK